MLRDIESKNIEMEDPFLMDILEFLGKIDGETLDLDTALQTLNTHLGAFLSGVQTLRDKGLVKFYFVDRHFNTMRFTLAKT